MTENEDYLLHEDRMKSMVIGLQEASSFIRIGMNFSDQSTPLLVLLHCIHLPYLSAKKLGCTDVHPCTHMDLPLNLDLQNLGRDFFD